MAAAITHEDVVRVAKEVFPGLTDGNILVEPQPGGRWTVTVTFAESSAKICVWTTGLDFAMGAADRPIDVLTANLNTEDELHRFLEACRDSFAKNLEALLALCLGPVRVLPKDDWLETRPIHELLGLAREFLGSPTLAEVLPAYETGVARRRAERAAKPGS